MSVRSGPYRKPAVGSWTYLREKVGWQSTKIEVFKLVTFSPWVLYTNVHRPLPPSLTVDHTLLSWSNLGGVR